MTKDTFAPRPPPKKPRGNDVCASVVRHHPHAEPSRALALCRRSTVDRSMPCACPSASRRPSRAPQRSARATSTRNTTVRTAWRWRWWATCPTNEFCRSRAPLAPPPLGLATGICVVPDPVPRGRRTYSPCAARTPALPSPFPSPLPNDGVPPCPVFLLGFLALALQRFHVLHLQRRRFGGKTMRNSDVSKRFGGRLWYTGSVVRGSHPYCPSASQTRSMKCRGR